MRTIKLVLAYDGSAYAGWQFQPGQPTLQAALERTLEKITGETIRVVASGRTDAGVHALGQVVSFHTASRLPADVLARALNAELPRDMAALSASDAPPGFNARQGACRKRYRYVLHDGPLSNVFERGYAWHCHSRLDVPAMQRAARPLLGRHDFASFETSGSPRETTVRTVFALDVSRDVSPDDAGGGEKGSEISDGGDRVRVEIEADGFLYNMVRSIVGTLVEVGRGAKPETFAGEAMAAADRRRAGPKAPAHGLFLLRVEYPPEQETDECRSSNVEGMTKLE